MIGPQIEHINSRTFITADLPAVLVVTANHVPAPRRDIDDFRVEGLMLAGWLARTFSTYTLHHVATALAPFIRPELDK